MPQTIRANLDPANPPVSGSKPLKTVGVLFVLAALSVAAVVVLMVAEWALVMFTPAEGTVDPRQRRLVVDISAVAAQIDDYVPQPRRETLRGRRYIDGSLEIEYAYARSDADDIYLRSTFIAAATPAEAKAVFRRCWEVNPWQKALFGAKKVVLEERDDLFAWGDESRLAVIFVGVGAGVGGKPAGNVFIARKGADVFYLLVTGVCFDRQEAFASLVRPTLARIEGRGK